LDPNDGYHFGRAVKKGIHAQWHKDTANVFIDGKSVTVNFGKGGPFNAVWDTFFGRRAAAEKTATADDITSFLEEQVRKGPVEIDLDIPGDRVRTFRADFSDEYAFSGVTCIR